VTANLHPEQIERSATTSLLKKPADKDDCADMVVTMCRAEPMTGQTVVIDSSRYFHSCCRADERNPPVAAARFGGMGCAFPRYFTFARTGDDGVGLELRITGRMSVNFDTRIKFLLKARSRQLHAWPMPVEYN
jgi:hypothetical protein